MGQYTSYPNKIDGSTELPLATDNVTPVKAEVVNRQRESIIAIETELGPDPSGTHTTVKARLDALEAGGIGGGGNIAVEENGSTVNSQVTNINFAGDVLVATSAPHQVTVTLGGNIGQKQETIVVSSNGQFSFTLSSTPVEANTVQMYVNGIKQDYGTDYTVSGTSVNYTNTISLVTTDLVEFWYLTNTVPAVATQYTTTIFKEAPSHTTGQTSFAINQFPFQASAVEMYINGLKQVYGTDYTVINKTISYFGIVTIQNTDKVEFEYFANAAFVPTTTSVSSIYNQTSLKISTYTATINDFVRCDPASGGFVVNLPSAVGLSMQSIVVKNTTSSTNSITIAANGAETIDGSSTQIINASYESLTFYSNGAGWDVI